MKHGFSLPILLLLIAGKGFSQPVSEDVQKHYSAAVIGRVYEINKFARLNNTQQAALATALVKEDSVLSGMITGHRNSYEIEACKRRMDDEIYRLDGVGKYYDSLASLESMRATADEVRLYERYKPTTTCMNAIRTLVRDKHYKVLRARQEFASVPRVRDSLERAICYVQDSLAQAALMKDGVLINSSQFASAIRFKAMLRLTDGQADSLLERGMYVTHLRDSAWRTNPLANYDTKDFETYWMSVILTDKQYSTILALRYQHDAEINAQGDWSGLEKRGLVNAEMDKTTVLRELTQYYIRLKSSSNLYAYDIHKQSAYARSVRENMPKALQMLQFARKHNVTDTDSPGLTDK